MDLAPKRKPIHLKPGAGRSYSMGGMSAVFLADGKETGDAYSISEWWLEPHTAGPGAHSHEKDDVFFVLTPGDLTHDFENRGEVRAGALNLSFPGGFEKNMPSIVDWSKATPPGRV